MKCKCHHSRIRVRQKTSFASFDYLQIKYMGSSSNRVFWASRNKYYIVRTMKSYQGCLAEAEVSFPYRIFEASLAIGHKLAKALGCFEGLRHFFSLRGN